MGWKDVILLLVVFGSGAFAVTCPGIGSFFQPYLLYMMMFLLFLSFLPIDFRAFLDTSRSSIAQLAGLAAVKLILLPTLLYCACLMIMPDYAVPVLLLSSISTGVVAPFIADILDADMALVLRMVVLTSLLVPFTLPCLVKLLAGAEVAIPLDLMIRLLAVVVFVPMILVVVGRRLCPGLLESLAACRFPVSLTLFALINLGVFSKYSDYFFQQPGQLLVSIAMAYLLSIIYYASGFIIMRSKALSHRAAAAVSLAVMNNVLVIVFASRFFGPLSPTLAAMYMFPFFTMIVPMRLILDRMQLSLHRRSEEP
jgi:bile acid:Na+ symporter, BASS family